MPKISKLKFQIIPNSALSISKPFVVIGTHPPVMATLNINQRCEAEDKTQMKDLDLKTLAIGAVISLIISAGVTYASNNFDPVEDALGG